MITLLSEYKRNCKVCESKRHTTRAQGDWAVSEVCQQCFRVCPACAGAEYSYARDERGYRYVKPCGVCGPLKARIKNFNEARIPARYHGDKATLGSFVTREKGLNEGEPVGNLMQVKIAVNEWVRGFIPGEQGFLLHGPVGTGKTHLLAATIRHLTLEKGYHARFIEFTHLLSELREQFDRGRDDGSLLNPLTDVPVLAIDELGKGRNNAWQLSIIDEIISKRYNRGLTTLFTTNYPLESQPITAFEASTTDFEKRARGESLRERIGERIYSRLYEMGEFIAIDAPDFRKRRFVQNAGS